MTKYRCWIPEYDHEEEDGMIIDAYDNEQAAKIYIKEYERDRAEYPVGSGGEITVMVKLNTPTAIAIPFRVWGYAEPYYIARRINE